VSEQRRQHEWSACLTALRDRFGTVESGAVEPDTETPPGVTCSLRTRAETELAIVVDAEVAGLLRRAARLRFAGSAAARMHPLDPLTESDWSGLRRRLRRELAFARAEGIELPAGVRRVAARIAGGVFTDWPESEELARASLGLQETEAGRLELGRGLLARGLHRRGAVVLGGCRRRGVSTRRSWLSSEGLGWAAETRGEPRTALGWYERSADEGAPAEVLVSAREMASRLRDGGRCRRLDDLLVERLTGASTERRRVLGVRAERRKSSVGLTA